MLYVMNECTSPYFNLALEEYILKHFEEECFMLWQDAPSVIVGKNQNALSEINADYVRENNIPVVRRLSGGGAVFHDLGNLNFTFIQNDMEDSFIDFKKFTQPIIEALKKLGVAAEHSGRNDLVIDGKKFSGNAQYKYRNRILHHGTLLFSSNITDLSASLNVNKSKFEDKAVKSVESRVTNISSHLQQELSIGEFIELIRQQVTSQKDCVPYTLSEEDLRNVNQLVEEKYSTWDWNYGFSPAYNFKNQRKFTGGLLEAYLNVNKGTIDTIKLYGDFFGKKDITEIEQALHGVKHDEKSIREALTGFNLDEYLSNIGLEGLIQVLF